MQTTRTPYSISFMATVLLLLLFACHSTVANAAVALGATRVIYPANQKQVLLPVTNNDPASVYLIQSWIENAGDQKDTQFVITPPLFSMQGKKENTLRIINATNHQLPGDRESLFWVNVKAIPAMEKDQKNENTLQLAIISFIAPRTWQWHLKKRLQCFGFVAAVANSRLLIQRPISLP